MRVAVKRLQDFLDLIRFSHTLFALPFALLGAALAVIVPAPAVVISPQRLALRLVAVILCMVFARSAAMSFNRLVDASIDARNPRTANRHLPSGRLSTTSVWIFFIAMTLGFLASCGLFLPNWLPLGGALPVLAWICGYSYAKRFTATAHLWLGVALALSPICAWAAIRGEQMLIDYWDIAPAVLLAMAIAFWVAGFDIIYACQDADFDRIEGLHSIPARLGVGGALQFALYLHAAMLIVLLALPSLSPQLHLGAIYYACLAAVSGLVLTQHRLVSPNDLSRVNQAFFHVNAVISFALSAVTALDAYLG